jgi:Ser/Thr protein kinase RdoA (MazF antagonist)
MLLSGDRQSRIAQLSEVVDGYNEFFDFETTQLRLIEPLRTLRMMHYCGWVASRWGDPAFPRAFPWFNTERYWGEHILELREQMAILNEPPLELM